MNDWMGQDLAVLHRRRPAASKLRIMHYSHDTFGLGHLRRTLTIARYVQEHLPRVTQLIVTGSPVAGDLLLPDDADYVKLPSVVKVGPEAYEARTMDTEFADVRDLRAALVKSAAEHFRPDILLVDHAPAGLMGELLPTLRYLKTHAPQALLVAGLRDVVDEPERVRRAWAEQGVYELLDQVYDRIVVYGQQDVYDVVRQYGLSASAAARTRFVGYLEREPDAVAAATTVPGDPALPLVVYTAGGGGDGAELLLAAAESLRSAGDAPAWRSLVVTGPLMDENDRAEIGRRLVGLPQVALVTAVPGLAGTLAEADAVVAMGGYNTVCEILSFQRPALIVPRVTPRREQLIRAQALARRGLLRMLHPEGLSPESLNREVAALLASPAGSRVPVRLDGLPNLVDEFTDMLAEQIITTAAWASAPRIGAGRG